MKVKVVFGPAPRPKRQGGKYGFGEIEIGTHIVIKSKVANANAIRACASEYGKKHEMKFSVSEQNNGDVTVERIL